MSTAISTRTRSSIEPTKERRLFYAPRGAAKQLIECRDPEIVTDGPAGTGKSLGMLTKIHLLAGKYAGSRHLIARKTRKSLTQSAVVTWNRYVIAGNKDIHFRTQEQEYRYPNGSGVVLAGMDKDSKQMSAEYDTVSVLELSELTEAEWEAFSSRVRYGAMPYQQQLGDTNPQGPNHWILQRTRRMDEETGRPVLTRFQSFHKDNPRMFYPDGTETPYGAAYLRRLRNLTGVRKERLYFGRWVSAEGMIYDQWQSATHVVYEYFAIPRDWRRYIAIDFGFTNPLVVQFWALDHDGRAYLYREIYQTGLLVEDAALMAKGLCVGEPPPQAVICDHDAEGRATWERHFGGSTVPAFKGIAEGIQAVQARTRVQADGKPRLYIFKDALVHVDEDLRDDHLPLSTEYEFESYVWEKTRTGVKETPVDAMNHGMDAMRYFVCYVDGIGANAPTPVRQSNYLTDAEDEEAFTNRELDYWGVPRMAG